MGDAYWAARKGDPLLHTTLLGDIISTVTEFAIYGAAIAVAGFLTGITGGWGLVILGAVVGATMGMTVGDKISEFSDSVGNFFSPPTEQAWIRTGSNNTHTNSKPSARAAGVINEGLQLAPDQPQEEPSFLDKAGAFLSQLWRPTVASPDPRAEPRDDDKIDCEKHPPMEEQYLAEGSSKVYINSQPAVRSNDRSTCEAKVSDNAKDKRVSPDVQIGGKSVLVREIRSGKTGWVRIAALVLPLLMCNPRNLLKNAPCLLMTLGVGYAAGKVTEAALGSAKPVHAALGIKFLMGDEDFDFEIPGALPIQWQRTYNSRDERRSGMFGTGWSVVYEMEIVLESTQDGSLQHVYIDEQGRRIEMGYIDLLDAFQNAGEGIAVRRAKEGPIVIESLDGVYRIFEQDPLNERRMRLVLLGDRNGNANRVHRDDSGRIISVAQEDGPATVVLNYDARHDTRVASICYVHDERLVATMCTYRYSDAGELIEVVNSVGDVVRQFAYDHGSRMTMHELPTGQKCFYEWREYSGVKGSEWRVVRHWTDAGDDYRFEYDLEARITRTLDGLGRTTERYWNEQFNVVKYIDAAGEVCLFDWNEDGQLLSCTDPLGGEWRFSYDEWGNITEESDPLGRTELTQYIGFWGLPRVEVDPAGNTWRYSYDQHGNLAEQQDPEGHVSRFGYNAKGLLVKTIDALGKSNQLRWDERSLLTDHVDCSGQRTQFTWDALGFLASITDAMGETTRYVHDAAGRLLQTVLPDGRTLEYRRDRAGLLTHFLDAAGNATNYARNVSGDVAERIDAAGRRVRFQYDAYGRLQGLQNENGQLYQFAWDAVDRLVEQVDIDGSRQQYEYNAVDHLLAVQHVPALPESADETATAGESQKAVTYHFDRDAVGRMQRKHTADAVTQYEWSIVDELIGVKKTLASDVADGAADVGHGQSLKFQYDKLGQLTAEQTEQGTLRHEYDALGNLEASILPDGRRIQRLYYGSGHLHQINVDGLVISDFTRDNLHREIERTQGALRTLTRYDRSGRVRSLSQQLAGGTGTAQSASRLPGSGLLDKGYEYDFADNLVSRVRQRHGGGPRGRFGLDGQPINGQNHLPASQRQVYRYDATGHIEQSLSPDGNSGLPNETFHYDRAANLVDDGTVQGASGSSQGFVRNNRLRVYQDKRYEWDGFGRLITKRIGVHTVQRFRYDSEHRLMQVDIESRRGNQSVWFEYDPLGRRIGKSSRATDHADAKPQYTRFHWDGMRLLQEEGAIASSLYIYEESEGYEPLAKLETDLRPLLSGVGNFGTAAAMAASLAADLRSGETAANDRAYEDGWPVEPTRSSEKNSGANVTGQLGHISSSHSSAEALRQATRIDSESLTQRWGAVTSISKAGLPVRVLYFQNDVNGTPEELTDARGDVVWNISYQVWGNAVREVYEPSEVTQQNIRFQGQYLDRETGLHYNTFRYYDPDVGRFTTTDPISLAGGFNLYQYAPNPLLWVDPWGWCPKGLNGARSSTKGNWGVNRAANQMERNGYRIVGREVRMNVGGKNIRADLVGYNPRTGKFLIVESKVGPRARLTQNQRGSGVFDPKKSTLGEKATLQNGRATDEMSQNMRRLGVNGVGSGKVINSDFSMVHYRFPGGVLKP